MYANILLQIRVERGSGLHESPVQTAELRGGVACLSPESTDGGVERGSGMLESPVDRRQS